MTYAGFKDIFVHTHTYRCHEKDVNRTSEGMYKLPNGLCITLPDRYRSGLSHTWEIPLQCMPGSKDVFISENGVSFQLDDNIVQERVYRFDILDNKYVGSYSDDGFWCVTKLPLETVQNLLDYFRNISKNDQNSSIS